MADGTKMLAIPADKLEQIANYLASRPWREVNMMLATILELQPVDQMVTDED